MITPTDIDELRRLDKLATAAPWVVTYILTVETAALDAEICECESTRDAELIVAVRNSLPVLLDEIERLRKECSGTEHERDGHMDRAREAEEECERLRILYRAARDEACETNGIGDQCSGRVIYDDLTEAAIVAAEQAREKGTT